MRPHRFGMGGGLRRLDLLFRTGLEVGSLVVWHGSPRIAALRQQTLGLFLSSSRNTLI
jgi:hypothetical protein